ncbi:hypothetical protein A9Q87_06550 [Flavobacteriales bacterium 34_180_T64]|nr:hypothetical protein A9Q87_06550 [Flavobacteriales bacterium 34_180_T64]
MFFTSTIAFAQFEEVVDLAGDLILLTNQYIEPAAEATMYQTSGGWYTSAKKKEFWDIEVSLQGNMLFIPGKSKIFLVDESQLQNLSIQGNDTTALIPTTLGGDEVVVLEGSINGDSFEFDTPEGINESTVTHYQVQASVGLWEGTTLIARYSPRVKINKTHYHIFGGGLQHNISQWIPGLKSSSFNIAGLVSYSNFSVDNTFSEVDLAIGSLNSLVVDGESFMFNLIASKQLQSFNFSTAIGVVSTNYKYDIGGEGDIVLSVLHQALNALDGNKTNIKADLGVDYNFRNFSVNTMLTIGNYTNLIFGINYNIRSKSVKTNG